MVALDEVQETLATTGTSPIALRQYAERVILRRVEEPHQKTFRNQILRAYEGHCAVCKIAHPSLLGAAHIISDKQDRGEPIVLICYEPNIILATKGGLDEECRSAVERP